MPWVPETPDKSNICHPTSPLLGYISPPVLPTECICTDTYRCIRSTYRCLVHPSKALFAHRDSTYACMAYIRNQESDRSTGFLLGTYL